MTPPVNATALADVCANLLAALLILFIGVLALPRGQGAPEGAVIALEHDPRLVTQRPLPPAELVELLRQRGPHSEGVSIDLHRDTLRLVDRAGARDIRLPLDRRALPLTEGPVRLFVFDQTRFATLRLALVQAGHADMATLSVPVALRRASGDDWSEAFLDLLSRDLPPSRFGPALARLLEGGGLSSALGNRDLSLAQPGASVPGATCY